MTSSADIVAEFIKIMVQAIVPDADAVVVDIVLSEENKSRVDYTVRINNSDARFLVGKAGVNAIGIKALARAAGQKLGINAEIKLDIPEKKRDPVVGATLAVS